MTGQERRISLGLAGLAFVLVLILWQVPQLNGLLYPFRYFVTTVHELGHGLAAILSGGTFRSFQLYASGAGVATTAGGSRWLVIPAGYVGTALFGAVLLILSNRTRHAGLIAIVLGGAFALFTAAFARSLTGIVVGLLTAGTLILLGWKAPRLLVTFVLNVLAMLTGLNALLDVLALFSNLNSSLVTRLGNVPNDAYSMAREVGILPAAGWAFVWTIAAVLLLGFALYVTFWQPLRNGELIDAPATKQRPESFDSSRDLR